MSIDVNKAIRELLYEQDAVIVPGLGGFTSTAVPSTVDYVQGTVMPPSKKLEFNPNLVINDGVLVQHLQKGNASTYQEAGEVIEKFVEEVNQALERKEIIEIPKVGRLYQDYEHKIRFMAEGTNFNADAFGLPAIEFSPVARERGKGAPEPTAPKPVATAVSEVVPPTAQETVEAAAIAPEPEASNGLLQKLLPWIVLLAAILLALTLYVIFRGDKPGQQAGLPSENERINVKPTFEEPAVPEKGQAVPPESTAPASSAITPATPPADPKSQSGTAAQPAQGKTVPDGVDTEEDTFEPGKQQAYLVVHSFGVKANASKFAQTLAEDGYAAETRKAGKLYRVGVVFPQNSPQDFEKMRQELARKYKAGPKTEKELDEMGQ
ncbi:MAG: SPOR domain-containing protein [Bacteroidetes bacterium]|nr:SPOR domain-containing protein [Bacteroidota bacterium]